ncbi:MAG: PSD1 and planctomycete cytochrome C domain-containing protein [Verrucomicrobiales bacterium]|nr:PSD1 and planctomycete cytochrome C domain-containing protein [Verrucomicrobiales bacterium]
MKAVSLTSVRVFFTAILILSVTAGTHAATEGEKLFTLKVQPLFSEKCNGCHGDDREKIKGEFDMLTRESLLAGGEYFGKDVLQPGNSAGSALIETVKWLDPDWEMPPKENDRLTEEQIALLEKWIDLGAPWADEEKQSAIREEEAKKEVTDEGIIVPTSGGLGDEWTYRRYQPEDVWAFMPMEKPEVPEESDHPIDAFLQAKLSEAGIDPAPEADPLTLIRRATYDLTGLPPTPEAVSAFRSAWKDNADLAWKGLIDELLASSHYGERWAQHWFDVARYADTGGMSNDYERSNAWRYRDYVIRAFNEDRPYNQFVIEQLAGDELADRSVEERLGPDKIHSTRISGDYTPEETEKLIATGFLRMGPYDDAMVKKPEARQIYLDDVVNSVGQTFLATTMRCFKCHDHKFDPLPTRDYYRMTAAFATTQLAERPAPFLEQESLEGIDEGRAFVQGMLDFATAEKDKLVTKRENAARAWYQENNRDYLPLEERKSLPDEEKPPRHVGLNIVEQGQLKVREQDVWIWTRRLERYEPMVQSVYNGLSGKGNARSLRIAPKKESSAEIKSFILTGGALEAPGEEVTPGVISALGIPSASDENEDLYALPTSVEGRRLKLAQWIANPANPLTARAFVNRVWQQHFGQAIAGNPNNFGVKGKKPTHPELLDWLASDFVENGWTLKRMHRLIMTSEAYRQASHHPQREELAVKDAENALLAYFPTRRLTAEELRDTTLAITGELKEARGGLPVMPEINMEVALQPRMIQFSLAPAYQPDATPERRNRRTIYAYKVRGMADPFLELFNRPNPNDSCEMRDSAAVSPQAFTLMNSDQITDRSIAFAHRLMQQSSSPDEKIREAFLTAFGREPAPVELARLNTYLADMTEYHEGIHPDRPEYPEEITRTLVEEFSGEPFDYTEILPAFENYVPDLKAADVDADTRALADLCLLLFNSNEFVYLY